MLTKENITYRFRQSDLLKQRVAVLKKAEELNKEFKNPNIVGGFLRDIFIEQKPSDCDVVFEGYVRNQPGIVESVMEAEVRLGIPHNNDWEFENMSLSGNGISGDIYEDTIGFYSNHTDFMTLLIGAVLLADLL